MDKYESKLTYNNVQLACNLHADNSAYRACCSNMTTKDGAVASTAQERSWPNTSVYTQEGGRGEKYTLSTPCTDCDSMVIRLYL